MKDIYSILGVSSEWATVKTDGWYCCGDDCKLEEGLIPPNSEVYVEDGDCGIMYCKDCGQRVAGKVQLQ